MAANVLLNNLYKHTPLQTTFATNFVALVDSAPHLDLRAAIAHYIEHQVDVITRRSRFRLAKAEAGPTSSRIPASLDLIDEIIAAIRASADRASAIRR